jgi:hypothetical protein
MSKVQLEASLLSAEKERVRLPRMPKCVERIEEGGEIVKSPTQSAYRVLCPTCLGTGLNSVALCHDCSGNGAILIPETQPSWGAHIRNQTIIWIALFLVIVGIYLWVNR